MNAAITIYRQMENGKQLRFFLFPFVEPCAIINTEHMFCTDWERRNRFVFEVKCNTKFQNARVNSICLEFSLAYIFALLIATPIALYNVHAADCLPVQIGVTNEKTRQSETFNI